MYMVRYIPRERFLGAPSHKFCTWILNVSHVAAALGPKPCPSRSARPMESVLTKPNTKIIQNNFKLNVEVQT